MRRTSRLLVFLMAVTFIGAISAPEPAAAQKINTAYISTTPGASTVIQVAKDRRIFDKHGIDATVIFISGSVRGIQAILGVCRKKTFVNGVRKQISDNAASNSNCPALQERAGAVNQTALVPSTRRMPAFIFILGPL